MAIGSAVPWELPLRVNLANSIPAASDTLGSSIKALSMLEYRTFTRLIEKLGVAGIGAKPNLEVSLSPSEMYAPT